MRLLQGPHELFHWTGSYGSWIKPLFWQYLSFPKSLSFSETHFPRKFAPKGQETGMGSLEGGTAYIIYLLVQEFGV